MTQISKESLTAAAKATVYGGSSATKGADVASRSHFNQIPASIRIQYPKPASECLVCWTFTTPRGHKANSGMLANGPLSEESKKVWKSLIHTPGTMFALEP